MHRFTAELSISIYSRSYVFCNISIATVCEISDPPIFVCLTFQPLSLSGGVFFEKNVRTLCIVCDEAAVLAHDVLLHISLGA
jgi:hypothetical protein